MSSEAYRIGDLARLTGTKVVTIRYYESVGLMPEPGRSPANYRVYGPRERDRLHFVRRCRDLGFSLDQIRELAGLSEDRGRPCGEVDALTRRHLLAVESKISDLASLAAELREIGARCQAETTVSNCRVVEALSGNVG